MTSRDGKMRRPEVGAVFVNPRGRSYEVIGHMLNQSTVVVRDRANELCDTAFWPLMTPENGWSAPRHPSKATGDE